MKDGEFDFQTSLVALQKLHSYVDGKMRKTYDRSLPFAEEISDRWSRAKNLGFGENSSVYDSCLVFGRPTVGMNCWVGPNTILDGSGGLTIGDWCTLSVGVQIYSHDNVDQTLTSGQKEIQRSAVKLGSNVYVGPNSVIVKGVEIGDTCIVGAFSYVNRNVSSGTVVFGQPAKEVGRIDIIDGTPTIKYYGKENRQ